MLAVLGALQKLFTTEGSFFIDAIPVMQSVSEILADSSAIAKPLLCSQSSIRTEYI